MSDELTLEDWEPKINRGVLTVTGVVHKNGVPLFGETNLHRIQTFPVLREHDGVVYTNKMHYRLGKVSDGFSQDYVINFFKEDY